MCPKQYNEDMEISCSLAEDFSPKPAPHFDEHK
jgi:hypothetical protein